MTAYSSLKNARGQGLVEYLIIVALIAVATIGVVRVMGQAVSSRFATITYALQGKKKSAAVEVDESLTAKKDLGDFMNGVGDSGGKSGGSETNSETGSGGGGHGGFRGSSK